MQVATFTDANPLAPLSDFPLANATIQWGDGATSNATAITQPGGVGTVFYVFGSHTYTEEGVSTVSVSIRDIGGATSDITTISAGTASTFASGLNAPDGLAFDSSGNLYVANTGDGTVSKVDTGGVVSTFASGFTHPVGLTFDGAGNLYVSYGDNAGTVGEVSTSGAVTTFANYNTYNSGLYYPKGLAFDSSGNLYAADWGGSDVTRLTPDGAASNFGFGFGGTENGWGLAFDRIGNLYVADWWTGTVSKVSAGGSFSVFASGFSNPTALAFDSSGNLYVANAGNNTVSMVTLGGVVSTFLSSGLNQPDGLAFDSSGNLYVANSGNNTVSKIPVVVTVAPVTASATVADAVLTAGALSPPVVTDGQAFTNQTVFHFTDADPAGTASDYTAVVALGDGSSVTLTSTPSANGQVVANIGGGFDVVLCYMYTKALSGQTFSVQVVDQGDSRSASDPTDSTATANDTAFTVAPATPTLTVSDLSGSYNASAYSATAQVEGVGAGVTFGPSLENVTPTVMYYVGTFTSPSQLTGLTGANQAPITAGNYTALANFAGSADYTTASALANFTITKANATISVTPYSVTYDGGTHTTAGSATGVLGESLTGLDLSGTTHTNAGTTTDTWIFTDSTGNYNNATNTVSDQISQASLIVTANSQTKVYGAGLPPLTASYSGFVNGDTASSLTTLPAITTTTTAASPVANYSITANGAVDSNYSISYVPGTLSINAAPLTVTANNQTKPYGAALPALAASYSGFVNGDTSTSLTTQPTITTTATASSPVGNYPITATGAADPDYSIGYTAGTLAVTKANAAVTLVSLVPATVFGQSVTFTATVSAVAPGAGAPGGTATFEDGTTALGTVTLTGSAAALTISTLSVGSHAITVVYSGDSNFSTSTSVPTSQTVGQAHTATTLADPTNPSAIGQAVTFTATVSPSAPGAGTPTGSVTFKDGTATLGTETLTGGTALLTTSTLALGTHSITAVYNGDTDFITSATPVDTHKVEPASADDFDRFGQSLGPWPERNLHGHGQAY